MSDSNNACNNNMIRKKNAAHVPSNAHESVDTNQSVLDVISGLVDTTRDASAVSGSTNSSLMVDPVSALISTAQNQSQMLQMQLTHNLQHLYIQQILGMQAALTAADLTNAASVPPNDQAHTSVNTTANPLTFHIALLLRNLNALANSNIASQPRQTILGTSEVPDASDAPFVGTSVPALGLPGNISTHLNPQILSLLGAQNPNLLGIGQQAQTAFGATTQPSPLPVSDPLLLPFPFTTPCGSNLPSASPVINEMFTTAVASLLPSGNSNIDQQKLQEVVASIATTSAAPSNSSLSNVKLGPRHPATSFVGNMGQASSATACSTVGKSPVVVYMECDNESLSEYQCVLRMQIELFEATQEDVQWNAQGRNKAIVLGQVGIRCRHCAKLPTWSRARGAVYYSATIDGLYQAAQNMAKNHLCRHCRLIPEDTKNRLSTLRDNKRRAAGGKKYWAEGARVLGVVQTPEGLYFRPDR
ncbi:hypothetical protein IV203_018044 [Nitzschia inconspicua]|uniref:Uncharacterized protein n=1 Tax=Nitzschia inconspicua TaxID=303405 RepID=A0A9K3M154_9STRA|nr:hypothetical protein IV203_018044 [Nitzschia inconspicua]